MKNILLYSYLISMGLIIFPGHLKTQSLNQPERTSVPVRSQRITENIHKLIGPRKTNYLMNRQGLSNHEKKSILGTIDTLNYPLAGTYTYYVSGEGGYVTGNNEYGDLAKANYFDITEAVNLTGIICDFVYATGGNPVIQIVVWDNGGPNESPGTVKATSSVDLNEIKNDISTGQVTYIPFNPPLLISTSFYAGFILPTSTGDTLAIWSNTDGDTSPGIAWEKWDTGAWYAMNSNQTWSLDIAMAIFPLVDFEIPLTANFTSNYTSIQIGQNINFQDLSVGNPTAWEWIFDGGNPAVSSLQNPVVTYSEAGSFNVTLTVWKDTINDSNTIIDYITVGGTQIEIDTLNYPLAGEYAVYITNLNGFVTGNNEYGDLAKANFFPNNQNQFITGMLMEFAYATGGNPNIELALWNNAGSNGKPGIKIGSKNVLLNTIKNQIINQQLTYVAFDPPVNVSSSFYAGFMLPTTTGDTLVIWSNTDGDTNPTTAWELWGSDNQWYSFSDPDSWGLNIALAIFPIMQNTLGIDENKTEDVINVFPNPSNGCYMIAFNFFESESALLSILKIDGTLISKTVYRNNGLLSIDLRSEPAGIYLVKIETDSNSFLRKLVKQ